jgi:predicted nucleic acid-binding protein
MPSLLDTNILVRTLQRTDPQYHGIRTALRILRSRSEQLCFTAQNLMEFWRVCTRPVDVNGFELTIAETDRRARVIEHFYTFLPDIPPIFTEWRQLVVTHAVSGAQVHDARLVAVMRVYGITHLLTLNGADFARYPGLTAVHPQDV